MPTLASTLRLLLAVLLLCGPGSAWAEMDADSEAARRRFTRGSELYNEGRYAEALALFEEARSFKPVPAFDYNIGRCLDRLERWSEALAAYERFLAASPPNVESEIRARVVVLRARVAQLDERTRMQTRVTQEHARSSPLRGAAIALLPTALALGVGGGVLVGLAGGHYNDLKLDCSFHSCNSDDWQDAQRQAIAGYSLLGVAGAVAIVDVGLWIAYARRPR